MFRHDLDEALAGVGESRERGRSWSRAGKKETEKDG